jgi:hypothetical protein
MRVLDCCTVIASKTAIQNFSVVPAKAGTHNPGPGSREERRNIQFAPQRKPVVMGPGVRRGDGGVAVVDSLAMTIASGENIPFPLAEIARCAAHND